MEISLLGHAGSFWPKRYSPHDKYYAALRFEAFRGFNFPFSPFPFDLAVWVAILQLPKRHLAAGSGTTRQYLPAGNSLTFSQPSHCSTMVWQAPPLNWQPFLVIKKHSYPSFIVVQTIWITSFLRVIWIFRHGFMPDNFAVVKGNNQINSFFTQKNVKESLFLNKNWLDHQNWRTFIKMVHVFHINFDPWSHTLFLSILTATYNRNVRHVYWSGFCL